MISRFSYKGTSYESDDQESTNASTSRLFRSRLAPLAIHTPGIVEWENHTRVIRVKPPASASHRGPGGMTGTPRRSR